MSEYPKVFGKNACFRQIRPFCINQLSCAKCIVLRRKSEHTHDLLKNSRFPSFNRFFVTRNGLKTHKCVVGNGLFGQIQPFLCELGF